MRRLTLITVLMAAAALSACDLFGESPEKAAAAREAEGKAIGGACRHAGRAIEDCYALNKKADKASVFAGWRDMNDYMRENKIEAVPPQIVAKAKTSEGKGGESKPESSAEGAATEAPAPEKKAGKPAKAAAAKSHE